MYEAATELIALLVIGILFSQISNSGNNMSSTRKLFGSCLLLNMVTIAVDLYTVYTITYSQRIPRWINMTANSVYFVLLFSMTGLYMVYACRRMLGHIPENRPLKIYERMILVQFVLMLAVVAGNWTHGWLFYFDYMGLYRRGPLWMASYVQVGIAVAVFCVYFHRYHEYIDKAMRSAFYTFMVVLPILMVYQLMRPDVLTSGITGAITAAIMYINLIGQRMEMDNLTKLFSRTTFISEIRSRLNEGEGFQLMLVNLLHFGNVNVEHGFSVGDEVLYSIAQFLEKRFSKAHVFRLNQSTFAVLCREENPLEAESRANALQTVFPKRWRIGEHVCYVQPNFVDMLILPNKRNSAGDEYAIVRGIGTDTLTVEQVMDYIEYARTEAVRLGTDSLHLSMRELRGLEERKETVAMVQSALEEKRFEMWYQPIYCTGNRMYCSAEALLRMRMPDGRYMTPDRFISVAEETNLMDRINEQILESVGSFLNRNRDLPISSISINTTVQQFRDPDFPDLLDQLHARYDIPKGMINLEITERMLFSSEPVVQASMRKLHERGYRFLLDDFGTGYSNFDAVLRFPFKKIKLDKTLSSNIVQDSERQTMVEMLTKLFHSAGMTVVAEGVETADQDAMLQRMGVNFIQGYYYAQPMPEEKYAAFIREQYAQCEVCAAS